MVATKYGLDNIYLIGRYLFGDAESGIDLAEVLADIIVREAA